MAIPSLTSDQDDRAAIDMDNNRREAQQDMNISQVEQTPGIQNGNRVGVL